MKFHSLNNHFFSANNPYILIDSDLFNNGTISVQNPINSYIVDLLNPTSKDVIIDGCCAPGGKGTYMSLIANQGIIHSIDNSTKRLKKMKENIKRHKIKNIQTHCLDMTKDRLPYSDKILIDVPCTGTGVINRRVELRWKKNKKDLRKMMLIQKSILNNSAKYLKNDGIIVYSTCSIEEEENDFIIKDFIDKNKNFILEDASMFVPSEIIQNKTINVMPGHFNLDGGYAARLRRVS